MRGFKLPKIPEKFWNIRKRKCLEANVLLLTYAGFWPIENEPHNWLYYWRQFFPRLQQTRMFYGILVQFYNMTNSDNIKHFLEHFAIFGIEIYVYSKLYGMIYRANKIKTIVRTLRRLQRRSMQVEETKAIGVIYTCVSHYFTSILYIGLIFIFSFVSLSLVPYSLRAREVPFRKWFPYDISKSPVFEITLATVMTMQTIDLLTLAIFDLLMMSTFIEIIGQFKILYFKIKNIQDFVLQKMAAVSRFNGGDFDMKEVDEQLWPIRRESRNLRSSQHCQQDVWENQQISRSFLRISQDPRMENVSKEEYTFEMNSHLKDCIQHHQTLLILAEELGSVLEDTKSVYFMVTYNALIGLAALYINTMALEFDSKVQTMGGIMLGCVAEYTAFCILGTMLTSATHDLSYAAYDSEWFDSSQEFKRSICFIMQQSQSRPIVFEAFKLFPLSFEVFLSVMKASYSYYAVLETLSSGESKKSKPNQQSAFAFLSSDF